jgi:hypothetical protein
MVDDASDIHAYKSPQESIERRGSQFRCLPSEFSAQTQFGERTYSMDKPDLSIQSLCWAIRCRPVHATYTHLRTGIRCAEPLSYMERFFFRIAEEKRTICVDSDDQEIATDIWKFVRQEAGETQDNPRTIRRTPIDLNLLKDARCYKRGGKEVMYWVLEPLLPT